MEGIWKVLSGKARLEKNRLSSIMNIEQTTRWPEKPENEVPGGRKGRTCISIVNFSEQLVWFE